MQNTVILEFDSSSKSDYSFLSGFWEVFISLYTYKTKNMQACLSVKQLTKCLWQKLFWSGIFQVASSLPCKSVCPHKWDMFHSFFCEHQAKSFKGLDRSSSKGQFSLHDVNWFCFPFFLISALLSRDSISHFLHEIFRMVQSKLRREGRNLFFLANRLRKGKADSYRKQVMVLQFQCKIPAVFSL